MAGGVGIGTKRKMKVTEYTKYESAVQTCILPSSHPLSRSFSGLLAAVASFALKKVLGAIFGGATGGGGKRRRVATQDPEAQKIIELKEDNQEPKW